MFGVSTVQMLMHPPHTNGWHNSGALLVANGKARQWQKAMTMLSNQGLHAGSMEAVHTTKIIDGCVFMLMQSY